MMTQGSIAFNSRERLVRVSWFWQWIFLASSGAFIGWAIGGVISEVLFLMFIKQCPDSWAYPILEWLSGSDAVTYDSIVSTVSTVTQLGKFGFAIAFALILLHGQHLFVTILQIKLTHRMLFFLLRGTVPPEEFNVFSDYLWAMLYCVSDGLFPFAAFIVLFFTGLSVIPNTLDFMFVVMGSAMAGIFVSQKAQEFVYRILYPHRLQAEINAAPSILELWQKVIEEKRKEEEQKLNGGNNR